MQFYFFRSKTFHQKKERKCTNSHDMKLYFGKRKFWKCNLRQYDQQMGLADLTSENIDGT